ncbi:MAG: HAD-IIIC family phosphatase [Bryobacterales bacterium]|nr:HAD-IIIC family phosphatase [Bryobacterales bacterium]
MRLIEALSILREPCPDGAPGFPVYLGCGFTPLDLKTFLHAHLQRRMKEYRVEVTTGLFGDLTGELERLEARRWAAVAVVVEWSDLDPRLGLRTSGGWRVSALDDIAATAGAQMERLYGALANLGSGVPVALMLPSLPLPPVSYTPRAQAGALEARLRAAVDQLALRAVELPGCRVVSREAVDLLSAPDSRSDPRAELAVGFPYTGGHADVIASLLAALIAPDAPRKGLITDLDDTLWLGIAGESGIDGLAWTLERRAQLHGLYQQLLRSLADAGALLAVASKNDPRVALEALRQPELYCGADVFTSIEASWGPKSESVERILKSWNIGPDAVVFVDDSPMEVAEVQAAFPAMDCRLFPKNDAAAAVRWMAGLRDAFGRASLSEEDRLRAASIRQAAGRPATGAGFLRSLEAVIEFSYRVSPDDGRPLDLINKTNQFNLNGRRIQQSEWRGWMDDPNGVVMVASYRDRFGPLGRILVLVGRRNGQCVDIAYWVLSCRAFSRDIEYACLRQLFERTGAEQFRFAYAGTPRNGPLGDFLNSRLGVSPTAGAVLSRERFFELCPELFHRIETVS